jgi:hypothetical protein
MTAMMRASITLGFATTVYNQARYSTLEDDSA